MADSLIDLFDVCVERLAAGESVQDCLRDYPDHADALRGMLELSALVFQVQAAPDDQQAQAHTRPRIEQALQTDLDPKGTAFIMTPNPDFDPDRDPESPTEKPKRSSGSLGRTLFWMGAAAAASFVFAMGAGYLAISSMPIAAPPYANEVSDAAFRLTATKVVQEVTQTADAHLVQTVAAQNAASQPTLVPSATMTVTVTSTIIPSMLPPGTATRAMLPTPAPTMAAPGSLPDTGGGAAAPEPAVSGAGDTAVTGGSAAIVSTSVASYDAMPPAPMVTGADDAERDGTGAASEAEMAEGVGGGPGDVVLDAEAAPLPENLMLVSTMPASASGSIMQQPLEPLKAGEIDDNAEWDTYMTYRRNFLETYGMAYVLDWDVSGRCIIKVTDGEGQPLLGAVVSVTINDNPNEPLRIWQSITYATGMTQFFPNADPRTARRDLFDVTVIYGPYVVTRTLDLREVGDVLTIKLPFVIVRQDAPPALSVPPVSTTVR